MAQADFGLWWGAGVQVAGGHLEPLVAPTQGTTRQVGFDFTQFIRSATSLHAAFVPEKQAEDGASLPLMKSAT